MLISPRMAIVSTTVFVLATIPTAMAQTCFYNQQFAQGKRCSKITGIERRFNNSCRRVTNGAGRFDKKILRVERRKDNADQKADDKMFDLGESALRDILRLAQGVCATLLDLTSLGDIVQLLENIVITAVQTAIEAITGLEFPPECIDEHILRKRITKKGRQIEKTLKSKLRRGERLDRRISDIESARLAHQDVVVCKCETLPMLLQEEFNQQCTGSP